MNCPINRDTGENKTEKDTIILKLPFLELTLYLLEKPFHLFKYIVLRKGVRRKQCREGGRKREQS